MKITNFINFAESYGFNAAFHRIEHSINDQNTIEIDGYLDELREIVINEQSKKRCIDVHWGDLLTFIQAAPE